MSLLTDGFNEGSALSAHPNCEIPNVQEEVQLSGPHNVPGSEFRKIYRTGLAK